MEGESGPKARPKGVVDGKQVNIPVLFFIWYRGTEQVEVRRYWISVEMFKVMRGRRKTILELRSDPYIFFEYDMNFLSYFQEKLELLYNKEYLYRKPTQVGW